MCLCTVCDFFSVAECAERERLYVKTKNRIYLIFFLLVLIQVFVLQCSYQTFFLLLFFLSFLPVSINIKVKRKKKLKKTYQFKNVYTLDCSMFVFYSLSFLFWLVVYFPLLSYTHPTQVSSLLFSRNYLILQIHVQMFSLLLSVLLTIGIFFKTQQLNDLTFSSFYQPIADIR